MQDQQIIEALQLMHKWDTDKSLSKEDRKQIGTEWRSVLQDKSITLSRVANKNGDIFPSVMVSQKGRWEGDFYYLEGVALTPFGKVSVSFSNSDIWRIIEDYSINP
jgi:hypothetical protein